MPPERESFQAIARGTQARTPLLRRRCRRYLPGEAGPHHCGEKRVDAETIIRRAVRGTEGMIRCDGFGVRSWERDGTCPNNASRMDRFRAKTKILACRNERGSLALPHNAARRVSPRCAPGPAPPMSADMERAAGRAGPPRSPRQPRRASGCSDLPRMCWELFTTWVVPPTISGSTPTTTFVSLLA